MARETFTLRVEVLDCIDNGTAIATAAAYLAYGDTTDTIGYAPNIKETEVHTDGDGPIAVSIIMSLKIQDDDHLYTFMQELSKMSKVLAVEREGAMPA